MFWISLLVYVVGASGLTSFSGFNLTEESHFINKPESNMTKLFKNNYTELNEDGCCERPILNLLQYINNNYFDGCLIVIVYDEFYETNHPWLLEHFVRGAVPHIHMQWRSARGVEEFGSDGGCRHFVFLLRLVERSEAWTEALPAPARSRVVLVTQSAVPQIELFLRTFFPLKLINVLVVADRPSAERHQPSGRGPCRGRDVNMYRPGAHEGAPVAAWRCTALTRPEAQLFGVRGGSGGGTDGGWSAHRRLGGTRRTLRVAIAPAPPFVLHRKSSWRGEGYGSDAAWDGIEIRLVKILAETLGLDVHYYEVNDSRRSGADYSGGGGGTGAAAAVAAVAAGEAEVAAAGAYHSVDRARVASLGTPHSSDCATFVTRTSTALPRYRAIMGPFHWGVWLALTLAYLFAIFPLAFSLHHSLAHLLRQPLEIENMFWYVFGTFTNCFTFTGKHAWGSGRNSSTLMLVGWYWMFTIIVTACYTSSIIAFVTIPIFPHLVDSSAQILEDGFSVGTVGNGEWNDWFANSTDPVSEQLMQRMEFLPNVGAGLQNVSSSYHPYAFLGSKTFLEYIIKVNHTPNAERPAALYLAHECFVSLRVALVFPRRAAISEAMDAALLSAARAGLVEKTTRDVHWAISLSAKGKLVKSAVATSLKALRTEEKKLSLDDIQGSFLLLGAGFSIAFFALFWECIIYVITKCFKSGSISSPPLSKASSMSIAVVMKSSVSQNELSSG